jgi:hypothetical protein
MLAVRGEPARQMITGQQVGQSLRVEWVRIDDPDPDLEGGATPVARAERGLVTPIRLVRGAARPRFSNVPDSLTPRSSALSPVVHLAFLRWP